MRVLIADKFEQSGRDGLQALGCEISYQPDVKDDALVEAIKTTAPDVLVVRGTKVTEPMLDAGPVKLIVRAGAGFNTIDVAAASKRGCFRAQVEARAATPVRGPARHRTVKPARRAQLCRVGGVNDEESEIGVREENDERREKRNGR